MNYQINGRSDNKINNEEIIKSSLLIVEETKQIGIETRFIKLAGEINADMPKYVVQRLREALKTVNKSIKNSKILVLG